MTPNLVSNNFNLEFTQIFNDITTFYLKSKKRLLSDDQKKIILSGYYERLRQSYNKLVSSTEISLEERTRIIFDIIPKFYDLLNLIPSSGPLSEIRTKISNLANFALSSAVGYSGESDNWLHMTSANILIRILTGIPLYAECPHFEKPGVRNFWEQNALYLNSLRGIVGIFQGAIISLSKFNISKDNSIEWANIIFKHMKFINEYVSNLDLALLVSNLRGNEQKIYSGVSLRIIALSSTYTTSYYLLRIFGDIWPQEINTNDSLPKKSLLGLIDFCEGQKNVIANNIRNINRYYSEGLIDPNEGPDKYPFINQLVDLQKAYDSVRSVFLGLREAFNSLWISNIDSVQENLLNDAITESQNYRNYLIDTGQGYDSYYTHFIGFEIAIKVVLSIHQKQPQILDNYLEIYYLKESEFQKNVLLDLRYLIILAKITINTELNTQLSLLPFAKELEKLLDDLQQRPRLYVSALLLSVIIKIISNESQLQELNTVYEQAKLILQTFGQVHLENKLQLYYKFLREQFSNNPENEHSSHYHYPFLKNQVNTLDVFSWIKPNFSKISKGDLFWYPFNLELYCIID